MENEVEPAQGGQLRLPESVQDHEERESGRGTPDTRTA